MGAAPVREYEFDTAQSSLIERLAGAIKFVGVWFLVLAALQAAMLLLVIVLTGRVGLAVVIQYVAVGALLFFQGLWNNRAAESFRRIAGTQGNDIGNLMSALGDLNKLYALTRVLIIIALVLFVLAAVMMAAFGGAAMGLMMQSAPQ